MNYFDVIISVYKTATDTIGDIATLGSFLFDDNDTKELIRMMRAKPENKRQYKQQLPCATISGEFSQRGKQYLKHHSGLICLDFDSGDNPNITDWETFKTQLAECNNILYAGLSCSGNGVFAIVPILYPEKHEQQFDALSRIFDKCGIHTDKSCRDITRLRFKSWDEAPVINSHAEPFNGLLSTAKPKQSNYTYQQNNGRIDALIGLIEQRKTDITDLYSDWVKIGYALATARGEAGRVLFHRLSRFSRKYNVQQCDRQFTQCLKSNREQITDKTLFEIAKRYDVLLT